MLGANLKAMRESANIGRTQMSKLLGLSRMHIHRIENGERFPSAAIIKGYIDHCKSLNTHYLTYLIQGALYKRWLNGDLL